MSEKLEEVKGETKEQLMRKALSCMVFAEEEEHRNDIRQKVEDYINELKAEIREAKAENLKKLGLNASADKNGLITIRNVYNSIVFKTNDDEVLALCMRDTGFEFEYQEVWYQAKEGKVTMNDPGE